MTISKRDVLLAAVALLASPARTGFAAEAVVNTDEQKVAIQGYDTVSYFSPGRPEKGSAENEVVWRGARWWFTTPANRALFAADPLRYAPQFGGFCAGAMAFGQTVKANPEAWTIVDGKLFMYFEKSGKIEADAALKIDNAKAETQWKALHPQP